MRKEKIFIVDDEVFILETMKELLQEEYLVAIESNSTKAMNAIVEYMPDLVILDIRMPHKDGYDLASEILSYEETKNIPILFLTGNSDRESIIKAFKIGAVDYVGKPFIQEELFLRIKTHLKLYGLQKNLQKQKNLIQSVLNNNPTMMLVSDGITAIYANETLLKFYCCESLEQFNKNHICICHTFVKDDHYFHLGTIDNEEEWIEKILELPQEKRIVGIVSQADFSLKVFNVSVNTHDRNSYIISFDDISRTISKQIVLEDKLIHDKLTHAYNREYFSTHHKELLSNHQKQNKMFGLAFIDIDDFKNVNDTYGHDIGDMVLIELVLCIKKNSRTEDKIIRWGGEEFVFITGVDAKDDFLTIVEHLRTEVETYPFSSIKNLTVSIGATLYKEDELIEATLKRADEGLYESKKTGKNKVTYIEI